jgi:hypothetical protein
LAGGDRDKETGLKRMMLSHLRHHGIEEVGLFGLGGCDRGVYFGES